MQKSQKVSAMKYGFHWGEGRNLKVSYWSWIRLIEGLHEGEVGKQAVRAELVWKP